VLAKNVSTTWSLDEAVNYYFTSIFTLFIFSEVNANTRLNVTDAFNEIINWSLAKRKVLRSLTVNHVS